MSKKDYYVVLGVTKNASDAEIKKAYRALAMKHHPDRNPGDKKAEALFKEATEAYEVLSDKDKRARYDQFGHEGMHAGSDYHGGSTHDVFSQFNDIFGNIFNQHANQRQKRTGPAPAQGHDLAYDLTISLKEALLGCKKEIRIYHYVACQTCKQTGTQSGKHAAICTHCNGTGSTTHQQGFFAFSQPCRPCAGNGYTIPDPCGTCRGQSRVQQYETVAINVPAGIYRGADLRMSQKGDAGIFGGSAGSLYIKIQVSPDTSFERRDNDLVGKLSLSYAQLVLGAQLEVASLDGSMHTVKVPKGCPVGHEIIIPGKGFPKLQGNGSGNLVFIAQCTIPKKISAEAKEALLTYDKAVEPETGGIHGFFKKFLG
jgi:molecular chaperone DnaJ